jgi:hypothetical protein
VDRTALITALFGAVYGAALMRLWLKRGRQLEMLAVACLGSACVFSLITEGYRGPHAWYGAEALAEYALIAGFGLFVVLGNRQRRRRGKPGGRPLA